MKKPQPFGKRLRNVFISAAALFGVGAGGGIIAENLPKDPVTDTQIVTTFERGTADQYGYNIAPSDQMWKATLGLKSTTQIENELFTAARLGDSWRVKHLMDHTKHAPAGYWALEIATYAGHSDVARALIDKGVSPAGEQSAPLIAAAQTGNLELAKLYLSHGARASDQESNALIGAAAIGDADMTRLLLSYGADPKAQSSLALWKATIEGHSDVANILSDAIAAKNRAPTVYDSWVYSPFTIDRDLLGGYGDTYGFSPWNHHRQGPLPPR